MQQSRTCIVELVIRYVEIIDPMQRSHNRQLMEFGHTFKKNVCSGATRFSNASPLKLTDLSCGWELYNFPTKSWIVMIAWSIVFPIGRCDGTTLNFFPTVIGMLSVVQNPQPLFSDWSRVPTRRKNINTKVIVVSKIISSHWQSDYIDSVLSLARPRHSPRDRWIALFTTGVGPHYIAKANFALMN